MIAVTVVASLVAITGLANQSFDLWGNASGALNGSSNEIDVDFSESGPTSLDGPPGADMEVWTNDDLSCQQTFGELEPLTAEADENDIATVPPGELELGGSERTDGGVTVWRHEDEIELTERNYSEAEFLDILRDGWSEQGDRIVDIRVGNRTADPLVIANISLEVERVAALDGTEIELWGGGSTLTTAVGFDLSEEVPVARIREGEDASSECVLGSPFFESYQIHVDAETIETIKVGILGTETLCLVRLKIDFWHEGEWKNLTYPAKSAEPIPVLSPPSGYQAHRTYLAKPTDNGSYELTIAE